MCDCKNQDVMTEWNGAQGTEHHYCCDTTVNVARADDGATVNLDDVRSLYDQ